MQKPFRDYDFEIADTWLEEAGVIDFGNTRTDAGFTSDESATIVAMSDIDTPKRNPGIELFKHDRLVRILQGINHGDKIPPVEICHADEGSEYTYVLKNGFHRFYASVALGFEVIPAVIVDAGPQEIDIMSMFG